ncbi:MAG: class I SAM-dependent methyltransferase [Chloroflexota bacterium]
MKQEFFICPRCRAGLERVAPDRLTCPQDGLDFWNVDGIWRFLLPESQAHFSRFVSDYEAVRRFEGRGSPDDDYYRALPFRDLSGKFSSDWAIRARSYRLLVRDVLTRLQERLQRPLHVLDLGAGNGWLSNRLAAQGDRAVAVDLLVNETDGLGAWKHYEHRFTPVQAVFERLPLMDRFADAVVFNASFHYSENYEATLREALRVLAPQGRVVIMDSPVYRRRGSGEKMVEERKADYLSRYGFASDSLESENFLTYARLRELGESLGLRWRVIRPFYGLRWWLRPLKARLAGRREPARFHLIVGRT